MIGITKVLILLVGALALSDIFVNGSPLNVNKNLLKNDILTKRSSTLQINFYSDGACANYENHLVPGAKSCDAGWFTYDYPGYSVLLANCWAQYCVVGFKGNDGQQVTTDAVGKCINIPSGGVKNIFVQCT